MTVHVMKQAAGYLRGLGRAVVGAWSTGIPQTLLCLVLQLLVLFLIPILYNGSNFWDMVRIGEHGLELLPNTPLPRLDTCDLSCIFSAVVKQCVQQPAKIDMEQLDMIISLAIAISSGFTMFFAFVITISLMIFLDSIVLNKLGCLSSQSLFNVFNVCKSSWLFAIFEYISLTSWTVFIIIMWPDFWIRTWMDYCLVLSLPCVVFMINIFLRSAESCGLKNTLDIVVQGLGDGAGEEKGHLVDVFVIDQDLKSKPTSSST